MAKVEILSEITGTVLKILAEEGDKVEEEDVLMIVESMKMEIAIASTADGVVKRILAEEGSQIAMGDVAFIVED